MTEIKAFTYKHDGKEYNVVLLDNEQLPCCASYFGSTMFGGELWLGVDGKLYLKYNLPHKREWLIKGKR